MNRTHLRNHFSTFFHLVDFHLFHQHKNTTKTPPEFKKRPTVTTNKGPVRGKLLWWRRADEIWMSWWDSGIPQPSIPDPIPDGIDPRSSTELLTFERLIVVLQCDHRSSSAIEVTYWCILDGLCTMHLRESISFIPRPSRVGAVGECSTAKLITQRYANISICHDFDFDIFG